MRIPDIIGTIAPALVVFSVIYGHYEEKNCQHAYGHWFTKSQYTIAAHVCKKCGHEEQTCNSLRKNNAIKND